MTSVRKTVTRLADGRELIYFDETMPGVPTPDRSAEPDQRPATPRPEPSELRYDPMLDEWVAIAAHRQTRTFLPPTDQCPLCPSTNGRRTEVPASAYDVAVFENRFPSFVGDGKVATGGASEGQRPELITELPGHGRCEVICFGSDHDASFATLTVQRARTVMTAWVDRVRELSALDSVAHIFPFENRGEEIGVTLSHPHGQIYGYPFVPPRARRMLDSAETYRRRTGRNLFDDVLAAELADVRVVASNRHWVAFVPRAAHWPVEVHLYPRQRVCTMDRLSEQQQQAFAPVYLAVLRALDANFDLQVPYIAGWYQAPVGDPGGSSDRSDPAHSADSAEAAAESFGLHVQVHSPRRAPDKLKYLAGSESGMGAFINDIRPEDTAARLRTLVRAELTDDQQDAADVISVPGEPGDPTTPNAEGTIR